MSNQVETINSLKENLDNLMRNIYEYDAKDRMHFFESISSALSGKFSQVTVALNQMTDNPIITITPKTGAINRHRALLNQKQQIEDELLKIENPTDYKKKKLIEHESSYPWKAGYVKTVFNDGEPPTISMYHARRNEFDEWYSQCHRIASDIGKGPSKSEVKEFRTYEEAVAWENKKKEEFDESR